MDVLGGLMHGFAAFVAEALVNPVSDDATKPGAQLGWLAQKPQMSPRRDKSFLSDVFALSKIANPAIGQRADQRLVARDNTAERVTVARQAARDELRVALFFCGHSFVEYHTAGNVPGIVQEVTENLSQILRRVFTNFHWAILGPLSRRAAGIRARSQPGSVFFEMGRA